MALQGAISSYAPSASNIVGAGLGAALSGFNPLAMAGSIATTGLGMLSNAYSSRKAFKRQKELMQLQAALNYQYNEKQTKNQYSWQRQGLEAANFNPMLAFMGSSGPSSQNWSGAPSSPMSDFSGTGTQFANALGALNQASMFENQNKLLSAQIKDTQQSAVLKDSEADLNSVKYRTQELENIRKTIENAYLPRKQEAEIKSMIAGAIYNNIRGEVDRYNAATSRIMAENNSYLVSGQVDYLNKNGYLTDQQAELLKREIKWYGANHVSDIIKDIGIGVGAGASAFKGMSPTVPNDFTDVYNGANGYTYKHSRYYH